MDRRKLAANKSRNALHKKLYSSSQLSITTSSSSKESMSDLSRFSSAQDESLSDSVSRKRKASITDQNEEAESADSTVSGTPPLKSTTSIRKKLKHSFVEDSNEDSENNEEEKEKSSPNLPPPLLTRVNVKKAQGDKKRKASDNSDDDGESASAGSYIRGVLEAIDKSPSTLSQSSSSSVDKYRKVNLRTPLGKRFQGGSSKSKFERKGEKTVEVEKKKTLNNSDECEESEPKEIQSEKLKTASKSKLNDSKLNRNNLLKLKEAMARKKKASQVIDESESSGSEENMSFSENEATSKKTTASKSPTISQKTPTKVQDENIANNSTPIRPVMGRVTESPELSPLKNFINVERNVTQRKKTHIPAGDKFEDFLSSAGITLCYHEDSLHIASNDPIVIVQKMKEILSTINAECDEIVTSWSKYIDNEDNLKKSLLEIKIETDDGFVVGSKAISLTRILLQVPQLQAEVVNGLFRKLIDAVIGKDSVDEVPWALQVLQQFRFLEIIVDPELFITRIEELLTAAPEWLQREVIVFIPDIVTDVQHHTTAEMLIKIMERNSDLTNIILDCIHNLILSKEYREELREHILGLLKDDIEKSMIPAITTFVLTACPSESTALNSLKALRVIDMSPSSRDRLDECYTNQSFMINAVNVSILLSKEVMQAAATLVKSGTTNAQPFDFIVLLLLHESTVSKKKIVEATLASHIKENYYNTGLLNLFYSGYKQVARNFQTTALHLATGLLKTDSHAHVEFGIEWMRNIFIVQSDTTHKQREVMEKLLVLMGNKDKTVKNVLEVLCRMANNEKERQNLQQHACFLRCFLEKVDNLNFDEVSTLYHLLHGLCTNSEYIASYLKDDLSIIMQKQLCSSKVMTKCKGVLGAVMGIKHLAENKETSEDALSLLKDTIRSLKNCMRSQALFYDKLGEVIASAKTIDDDFLSNILDYFEDEFTQMGIVSQESDNLRARFGLNEDDTSEDGSPIYIHFGPGINGAFIPVFFKLLGVCFLRKSGDLETINALLGCPVLMPADQDMPEPSTADYMINCINWFRELIGAFVHHPIEKEQLLRDQVLKRLEFLMSLQGELVSMVAMCEKSYQPPSCYFHYFPTPQFVRKEIKMVRKGRKKGGKKGSKKKDQDEETENTEEPTTNKPVVLPEWESWETGVELTVKNPAYFRRLDAKIINLLDTETGITIPQVCFIIKEILAMLENQASESLVSDLINSLPRICSKMQKIVIDLKEKDDEHDREAIRLILRLLICLFSWKGWDNSKYNNLLRDGLRQLAGMMKQANTKLTKCKELVSESYKYYESLSEIATQISIAVALVNMCGCLMKRSKSFKEESKNKLAEMAYGFLCLEWSENHGALYRAAVKELLNIWISNEPDPLKTVSSIMKWLPAEIRDLKRPQSPLSRMPSINKIMLPMLLKQLLVGVVKGIDISLDAAASDPVRIKVWLDVANCLDKVADICKILKSNAYLTLFLRYSTIIYQPLISSGMKILEANVKYQTEEVLDVIKLFQRSGRFLRDIFCTARKDNNVTLLTLIPVAKSRREKFIFRVKGMLTANNSLNAFWMGNLLNKDLDGEEILSESSEEVTVDSETTNNHTADEENSEIFKSGSEEDLDLDEE